MSCHLFLHLIAERVILEEGFEGWICLFFLKSNLTKLYIGGIQKHEGMGEDSRVML